MQTSKDHALKVRRLRATYFNGANLFSTHFENAALPEAHLEKAVRCYAHFEGALLPEAHFNGANLSDMRLEGADLEDAKGLTQEQLDSDVGDKKTLYQGVCPAQTMNNGGGTAIPSRVGPAGRSACADVDHDRLLF
jgi:hypothetical protein